MFARVTTVKGDPARIDEAVSSINGTVIPFLKGLDGFVSASFLADRTGGKVLGVAYWDSEEAVQASGDKLAPIREEVAKSFDGEVVGVEIFEVVSQT